MSRDDGFTVMDVSTSIVNDPKFRLLHRERPDHVAPAFMAYVAVLGESWKAGRRVSVNQAWPVVLPFDADVVASMVRVRLVDRSGLPPRKAWDGWFGPANERREKARERWRRANANRNADTAEEPRGSNDVPMPPLRPSVPPAPSQPGEQGDTPLDDEPRRIGLANPGKTA